MRGVVRYALIVAATVAVLAGIGLLVAALSDTEARDGVAWALWIGGALIALVAAGGGSSAENYSDSRQVLGGRFTDSPPLPTNPLQYALLGVLCVGAGTLVFLFG